MLFVDPEELLRITNGGLDILLELYPDAAQSVHQPNRKFKVREEKTASAKLNRHENGTYLVFDHGGDIRNKNGIHCFAFERGLSYTEALQDLAKKYNLAEGLTEEQKKLKPDYSERTATPDEPDGKWEFCLRDNWLDKEIETIFSVNTLKAIKWKAEEKDAHKAAYSRIAGIFKEYRWYPVISYSIVKNRKHMTFSSTEDYPIFLIDEGHRKIYQPFNIDKGKRFMYEPGTKPKNFLHGLDQLKAAYNKANEKILSEKNEKTENADRIDEDVEEEKSENDPRFEAVFCCTGGSDALNVALLKHYEKCRVVWPNSETERLSDFTYNEIATRAKKIYNIPDLDKTGKAEAHRMAMQFLELYTIVLPQELLKHRDRRGNACKDLRDYLNHYKKFNFDELIADAKQYQFWEKAAKYDRKGNFKNYGYELKNTRLYNFLQNNGFYRYMVGAKETEWEFIKITNGIVKFVNGDQIRDFIKVFLRDRREDENLRDAVFSTPKINDTSLANLDVIDIEFKDFTKVSQAFFFKNVAIEVTASEIFKKKHGQIESFVWENDVIDHGFNLLEQAPFKISKLPEGGFDIEVLHNDCLFFNYLINASRSHWRTELEKGEKIKSMSPSERAEYHEKYRFAIDGPNLNEEEIAEQKLHLINKIFVIGYLLHRYKDASKPWMIFAQDGHTREDFLSHGRSGKSILFDGAITMMLKNNFHINGRDTNIDRDQHKYHGVTEFTRYIHIEDAHQYLNLDVFFNDITGKLEVNPKNLQKFTIPFYKSPKFAVTTNFTGRNLGGSLLARLLNTVFSDYYHDSNASNDYLETRSPRSEFGINLFSDFDRDQNNLFYNTMIYCLQFFLQTDVKLEPEMSNVTRRQLLSSMGEAFYGWAKIYFSPESDNLNEYVVRQYAYKDHNVATNSKHVTSHLFLTKLRAYCQFMGWELNPVDLQNKQGTIIKRVPEKKYDAGIDKWYEIPGSSKPMEMLFIRAELEQPIPDGVNVPIKATNNNITTDQEDFPL